jgi:predicted component of viral defense system (DUF524 family)
MTRLQEYRRSVLQAVQADGHWTPTNVPAYNRARSADTYEALHYWVRKGRITYTPNRWEAV